MNELCEIIRGEIAARGAISFERFMELSLYCPEFGYYERLANTPGRDGDFLTSVSVGPLLGELLAFQFARWVEASSLENFQLLEAGAHDGRLALDVLDWFKSHRPRLFAKLEYRILEPSHRRRQWQASALAPFADQVRWSDSWEDLPRAGVQGVIFSNELLDAFPVRRLGWDAQGKKWFEWDVGWEAGRFVWLKMPLSPSPPSALCVPHLDRLPEAFLSALPDGFTTEASLAAEAWWRRAACSLNRGHLLTLDYGLTADEFLLPQRANGTLRGYHRQRLSDDVLANVGDQDLTAHVNFTALDAAGSSQGLKTEGLCSQAQCLTRIAEQAWKTRSGFGEWTPNRTRQFQTLTHPEHLGRPFKVLIQSR